MAARSGILDRVWRGGRFVLIDSLSRGSSAFFLPFVAAGVFSHAGIVAAARFLRGRRIMGVKGARLA